MGVFEVCTLLFVFGTFLIELLSFVLKLIDKMKAKK